MNEIVEPQPANTSLPERPRGLQGLLMRAQMTPVGYRVATAHFLLLKRFGALGYSFLVFVLAPTLVASLYLTLWASREFELETRLAVRSGTESVGPSLNDALAMFSSFGIGKATSQDAFIVADYIRSRTIIDDLGGKPLVHDLYSKHSIDFLSRLKRDASLEEVWKY